MCETLTRALLHEENEVRVVSLYSKCTPITSRMEKDGIILIYLGKKKHFDFNTVKKLKREIKSYNPDIIHTHLYSLKYAIFATLFSKRKIVHTIHNMADKECNKIHRLFNGFFYRTGKVIPVGLSEEIKKSIVEEYKLKSTNVPYILNGVDLSKCTVKTNYSIKENFSLINIARFYPQKNHRRLIDSFKMALDINPKMTLTLIGDGEEKAQMEKYVDELDVSDKVHFVGSQDNVFPYLYDADTFILTSDFEGIPITIIEAMGTGLPIISTNVGGVSDMLADGQEGFIVNCDDRKIADAIVQLAINEPLRQRMGRAAYIRAQKFSAIQMGKRYLSLYKEIVNEN